MSLNRSVAVLTPLVFAPLAGAVATWIAEHFPGVEVSQSSIEEIFIAGALIAFAKSAQWMHGWQKWEAREAAATAEADRLDATTAAASEAPVAVAISGDGGVAVVDPSDRSRPDDADLMSDDLAADEDWALDDDDLYIDSDPLIGSGR
jgi:hypothetical protein